MGLLDKISQKTLLLIMGGILLLTFTASSAYGIWPQVKDINVGLQTRNELQGLVSNKGRLDEKQESLAKEIQVLKQNLKGDMADLPEKKMESFIIGELQNISWDHDIALVSVKPVEGNDIQMFQEIMFNIYLKGEYFNLYSWLIDLKKQLGFVVIKNLEMSTLDQNKIEDSIEMKLTVASYKSK